MRWRMAVLLIAVPLLNGCLLGTVGTRVANEGDAVGRYPLQAVGSDLATTFSSAHPHADMRTLSLISIPLDLVVDVVLLPVDLIIWPFGFVK